EQQDPSASNNQQCKQIHSPSSESSLLFSSSLNTSLSDITDISRSTDELPTRPILVS
ncbi:unnamed protein product, partial [Rotaria sordida]